MKIKTFRFKGSKTFYNQSIREHANMKDSENDIDYVINDFIKDNVNELIDIKITTIDCMHHNNGGYNNVDLIYTIIYK